MVFNRIMRVAAVAAAAAFWPIAAQAIDINKSFSPTLLQPTQTTRIRIEFTNNLFGPATDADLTDTLPNDVFIATPANLVTNCGGVASASNAAGSGSVTLTGATIPARVGNVAGTCFVEVSAFAATSGSFINQIPAGALSATQFGLPVTNIQPAEATLAVILQDLTGSMSLSIGGNVVQGGETVTRTITLNNPNDVDLTGVAFTHDLSSDQGFNLRASGPVVSTCGGSTVITPTPSGNANFGATSTIDVSGATIPAGGSCTISYPVTTSRDQTLPFNDTTLSHTIPAGAITTNEGATNITAISNPVRTVSGVRVAKQFNGAATGTLNTNTAANATVTIRIETFNSTGINPFVLTDLLPAGLQASNIFRNTCGGTSSTGSGGEIGVTGASLPGVGPAPLSGVQSRICEIEATVAPTSTAPASYVNQIPAGSLGPFQHTAASATLNVTDFIPPENPLVVSKAFQRGNIYPGDTETLTFTFRNNFDQNIRNIALFEDLVTNMTAGAGLRIGGLGVTGQTCGASTTAVPGTSAIDISGIDLGPGQSCTVSVQVTLAANAPASTNSGNNNRNIVNTVPASQITFDLVGATGLNPEDGARDNLRVRRPIDVFKSYAPATVASGGDTRMQLRIQRTTRTGATTSAITLTDTLPAGHTISAVPDLVNECGGTATAVPGSNTVTLAGGAMGPPVSGISVSCSIFVNVTAPASNGSATNTIPAGDVTAIDDGQPAGLNQMVSLRDASATLTRAASSLTVNKEFLTLTVAAGQPSRVRITLSNTATGAVDLTGVRLTDTLTAPLQLAATVNPTFTTTSGAFNSGGCRGGSFTTVPGPGGSISLSNASIDAGATCYFEFESASRVGGNVQNRIEPGEVVTDQGATNPLAAVATLTVEREIYVAKGFSPEIVEPGQQSLLTVSIVNPTDLTFTGPSPGTTLQDTMPAGVSIVPGTQATTCSGASASAVGDTLILTGGTLLPNSTCTITSQVTATAPGRYENLIPAGSLTTVEGGTNNGPSSGLITAVAPPTIAKTFSPATIDNGAVSTITFTVTNPNSAAVLPQGLTGGAFTDTLTNMVVASPPNVGGTCANLAFSTSAGGSSFSASDLRLLPGASCTVTLQVTSTVPGTHPNQTSGVTTTETPTPGAPSNIANLTVDPPQPVTIAKSFYESTVLPNTGTRLVLTLTNPNVYAVPIGTPGFADTFPTSPGAMVVAATPGVFTTCGGAVQDLSGGAVNPGDTGIRLLGGTVPAGGTCFVAVNVQMPANGTYTNTTSALNTSVGTSPGASDTIEVDNSLPIASAVEPVRNVNRSDNDFFVDSILGPGDTLAGQPAVPGPGGNTIITAITASPGLSVDPDTGVITVAGGTPPGTYTVEYTLCQATNPANCAPPRTETVVVSTSSITATTDFGTGAPPPLVVRQADFNQEPGNVLGPNDTLTSFVNNVSTTVPATVAPGTGGNVDLSILSVTGPGGPTGALSVNVNTGVITVDGSTPPGDYTITYQICEDDLAANCAIATETVQVRVTPIVAASEPARNVPGSDAPQPAGNILGAGDQLDNVAATVGPAAAGSVDLTIDSILDGGGGDASSLIAVDLDTGDIVVAPGTPDGTYTISYTICEEINRGNCASATETVIVTSTGITAGPEAARNVTGSDGPVSAGSALDAANDTLGGAPATLGPSGNTTIAVVPGADSDPELSLNVVTGEITVAAGTPAGTYTVRYRLCDAANTDNCAEAVETVIITDTPIVATTDFGDGAGGNPAPLRAAQADSDTRAGVVLGALDTVNGIAAVPGFGGNVQLSLVSADAPLSLDPNTGEVIVAPGTAPGQYTLTYEICDLANLDNCAQATETVEVFINDIRAGPEPLRSFTGSDAPISAGNLLDPANDTLGTPAAAAVPGAGGNVVLTVNSILDGAGADVSAFVTVDPATGEVTLAAGAPEGDYLISYTICEAANLSNCAGPVVEPFQITDTAIAATGATFGPIDNAVGGTTPSIYADDDLGGVPPVAGPGGTVTVSVISPFSDPGLTIDLDTGIITVAIGTPPGDYTFTYEICEVGNTDNCAQATETVTVTAIEALPETFPPITTDGGVTTSILASDTVGGQPATLGPPANVTISVLTTDPEVTLDPATGLITLAPGNPAGAYEVEYEICSVAVPAACDSTTETVIQAPIAEIETIKTQVITDNGDGVTGVGDLITYTITVENRSNVDIENVVLTDTLTAFDLTPLPLTSGPTFVATQPPAVNTSPEGSLQIGETATYEATFLLTIDAVTRGGTLNTAEATATTVVPPDLVGIVTPQPVDDATDGPTGLAIAASLDPTGIIVTKATPRGVVERGSTVPYTITVENQNPVVAGTLDIVDALPPGFLYVEGSATLDGAPYPVTVAGRIVTWDDVPVPPLTTVTATLEARVTTGAPSGELVNTASARNPATGGLLAPQATATVRILPEPVFDCGDVIGKVFDDENRDGYQNQGEPGIPAARLAGVDGTIITADAFGRFHVPCAALPRDRGSNFILKLDTRSLPAGYRVTTENPRVVRLTPGKMTEMNFGAAITRVARVDINTRAFVAGDGGRAELSPALRDGIGQLLPRIADEAVNLRIAFHLPRSADADAVRRARALSRMVEDHIRREWRDIGQVKLTIEHTLVRAEQ